MTNDERRTTKRLGMEATECPGYRPRVNCVIGVDMDSVFPRILHNGAEMSRLSTQTLASVAAPLVKFAALVTTSAES